MSQLLLVSSEWQTWRMSCCLKHELWGCLQQKQNSHQKPLWMAVVLDHSFLRGWGSSGLP